MTLMLALKIATALCWAVTGIALLVGAIGILRRARKPKGRP